VSQYAYIIPNQIGTTDDSLQHPFQTNWFGPRLKYYFRLYVSFYRHRWRLLFFLPLVRLHDQKGRLQRYYGSFQKVLPDIHLGFAIL
jgi:hypothetical protein